MNKVFPALLLMSLLLAPSLVTADVTTLDPMVVTANRVETALSTVGSSVTVISREEIEQRQAVHLLDLLRTVPALDVVRQGGIGQQTSVFLRGANSGHTLVLVDGIEMNDPSNPGRLFDFASLSVDNIEQIEIMRGPGSTLYGSDAMGGVIHIITRRGAGDASGSLNVEAGSFDTRQANVNLQGGSERFSYSLAASQLTSEGISAAAKKYGNSEKDGTDRKTLALRLGATPSDVLEFDLFFRGSKTETDLDNSGGSWGDDPNNRLDSRAAFVRAQAKLALLDHAWEQTFGVSLTDHDRVNRNDTDTEHPFDSVHTRYDSRMTKVDWQHDLTLGEFQTLTLGAAYEKESASSSTQSTSLDYWTELPTSSSDSFGEETARTAGYYIQDQIRLGDNLHLTLGARIDDHSRFGSHDTWRATASYRLPATGTRFKGSYGTAFKAPTLAQLYENSTWVAGNPNLEPEKSRGWDIGVEQAFLENRVQFGATWFESRFDNLISTLWNDATVKAEYLNIDEARSRGLELSLTLRPLETLTLAAGYTYTDAEDRTSGDELLRRPRDKYTLNLNYRLPTNGDLSLDLIHVGSRKDYDSEFPWPITTLKSYTVVNLAGSYPISEQLELTGRIENLFDEDYEEVSGYGTPGIAGYVGAKLSF